MTGSRPVTGRLTAGVAGLLLAVPAGCSGEEGTAPRPQGPDNTAITAPTTTPAAPTTAPTTDARGGPDRTVTPTRPVTPRVAGVVARDLEVPWGIDFLPDGSALVTERDNARILRIGPSGRVSTVGPVSGVVPTSEGGLLGLAVSPSYRRDNRIYVYLTTDHDNRVVSMRYDGRRLGPQRPVLTGIPFGPIHDGGRLEFGPDGRLYVSTGESGDEDLSQDRDSLGGKILRINPDGSVPAGNPVPRSPVWTFGHRNVQGLAFDTRDRLWATEFGSDVWDELNRIEKGLNYGWPAAEGDSDVRGFTDPLVQWRPDNASPSGLAYAAGSLWAASLNGERLWQVPVRSDGGVRSPRPHFVGDYGRLRTVVAAPDGSLWVSTSNHDGRGNPAPADDRILRLVLR
ncbi:MAG: PQQ-dependent sugar dehydrogenase [Actinomycetota bacterium]|nr:PQQ-dependent sugar dehydrogenase [Actinomycetota bacterium]